MAHYKNGKYWRSEQDDDMKIMLTIPNDTKEWLQAYKRTVPRLRRMGEFILRRYFYCSNEKADDLITDAITNLLIKGNYNPDKPKMYSYCGTVIKRYFYDMLVIPFQSNGINTAIDRNYDINDSEWLAEKHSIQPNDEFDIVERQELYNGIIEIIEKGLKICQEVLDRNDLRSEYESKQGSIREKEFLIVAKEYFNEYFMTGTVSIKALADHITARVDMPQFVISRYLRRYFNISSEPFRIDNIENGIDWVKKRGASSYLMDDDCPNDVKIARSLRQRSKKINSGYKYF